MHCLYEDLYAALHFTDRQTAIHTMTEMNSYTERRLETINHKNHKVKSYKGYMYRQSCKCQHFAAVLCWEQFSGS